MSAKRLNWEAVNIAVEQARGGSMINVIKTTGGTYNVIGTDNGMFVLQGNLTEAQLKELLKKGKEALK